MPSQRNTRRSSAGRAGGSLLPFFLGVLCTLALLVAGGWAYLRFGHLPVAAADPAFPFEATVVHVPLEARIHREMQNPPFGESEDVLEAGAKIYVKSCASCHGTPGHDSAFARWMYPRAPQLWKKHANSQVVGVSDDPAGESFWKVKNGIRLTGMPAYAHLYSTVQMWDVSLLLKNADQPLPEPVMRILSQPPPGGETATR